MLEGYRVVKELGSGSYSKVFLVELDNKLYAAKAIPRFRQISSSNDPQYKPGSLVPNDNFIIKEIKTLQKLIHPNIISIVDVIGDANNIYIIQEYIENSLFKMINQQKKIFLEFSAKPIITQILDALCYLHAIGICHRDIKPQNILIDSKGSIRIIDFGLSTATDVFDIRCGSTLFFPPEVMVPADKRKPIDGCKCDSWACGVTFYLMLTGKLPWSKMTYDQITTHSIKFLPYMSSVCIDFLSKLLHVDPNERISVQEAFNHEYLMKSIRNCSSISFSVHTPSVGHMSYQDMYRILHKEFPDSINQIEEESQPVNLFASPEMPLNLQSINLKHQIENENHESTNTEAFPKVSTHAEKHAEFNNQIDHILRKLTALRKSSI